MPGSEVLAGPGEGEASEGPLVDIGRLIDDGAWGARQKFVVALGSLGFALEGLAGQVIGPSIPVLAKAWHTPRASFAAVSALGLVGFILGSTIGGVLGDRLGRRFVLIATALLIGAGTIGCAFASNPAELGLWRVLAGLGLGACIPASAVVITEFTPARYRGVVIAVGATCLPVGGSITGALASYILPRFDWTVLYFFVGGVALAAAAVFYLLLPESPRFLARSAAQRGTLIAALKRLNLNCAPNARFFDHSAAGDRMPVRALLEAGLRRDTICLWGAFFCIVFAMYAIFSWMPTALVSEGLSLSTAGQAVSSFALGGIAGNLLGGWLTGRFGSRISLAVQVVIGLTPAAALCLLHKESAGFVELSLILIFLLGAGINGVQTALYVVATALYRPSIRSTGVGLAVALGRVGALLSSYVGVFVLDFGGARAYFTSIGVAVALVLGFSLAVRTQIDPRSR